MGLRLLVARKNDYDSKYCSFSSLFYTAALIAQLGMIMNRVSGLFLVCLKYFVLT